MLVLSMIHSYIDTRTRHAEWEEIKSVIKGLLVEVVLSVAGSHALEVSDVVSHLFDTLHLLLQEIALQKISHL